MLIVSLTRTRRASAGGSGSKVYVRTTLKLARRPFTVHTPSLAFDLSTTTSQPGAADPLADSTVPALNSFHSGPGLEKPEVIVVRSSDHHPRPVV